MEPDRGGDVDVSKMADVLQHRPSRHIRSAPKVHLANRSSGSFDVGWHLLDHSECIGHGHRGVGDVAFHADVELVVQRREWHHSSIISPTTSPIGLLGLRAA
jgi:hypothetical protein